MGFIKEFKEFAMKGNVMDMAVGVIIGGAFGKIVTSLVDDVLMPFIGMLTGGVDLSGLEYKMMIPAVEHAVATDTTLLPACGSAVTICFGETQVDFLR